MKNIYLISDFFSSFSLFFIIVFLFILVTYSLISAYSFYCYLKRKSEIKDLFKKKEYDD